MPQVQKQKSRPDDVSFCFLQRGKVQEHRILVLRELWCNELLHLWFKMNFDEFRE
jgi:hypothetical protein